MLVWPCAWMKFGFHWSYYAHINVYSKRLVNIIEKWRKKQLGPDFSINCIKPNPSHPSTLGQFMTNIRSCDIFDVGYNCYRLGVFFFFFHFTTLWERVYYSCNSTFFDDMRVFPVQTRESGSMSSHFLAYLLFSSDSFWLSGMVYMVQCPLFFIYLIHCLLFRNLSYFLYFLVVLLLSRNQIGNKSYRKGGSFGAKEYLGENEMVLDFVFLANINR